MHLFSSNYPAYCKAVCRARKDSLRLQWPWIALLSVTSSGDGGREVATVHGNILGEESFDDDIL